MNSPDRLGTSMATAIRASGDESVQQIRVPRSHPHPQEFREHSEERGADMSPLFPCLCHPADVG